MASLLARNDASQGHQKRSSCFRVLYPNGQASFHYKEWWVPDLSTLHLDSLSQAYNAAQQPGVLHAHEQRSLGVLIRQVSRLASTFLGDKAPWSSCTSHTAGRSACSEHSVFYLPM